MLATFVLTRHAINQLSELPPSDWTIPESKLSEWNKASFKKLSRVGQLGAILVSGLSAENQNLIWISDEDSIAPNFPKLHDATQIIGHYLNLFSHFKMGHVRFGTTASHNPDTMQLEDIVALTDLATGAISELFTKNFKKNSIAVSKIIIDGADTCSTKTKIISDWLVGKNQPFGKFLYLLTEHLNFIK